MAVDTFYFDGHNGITDPDSVWSNDGNAFNGDETGNTALTTSVGSTLSNYIQGSGTSAPLSLGTVSAVRVRMRTRGTGSPVPPTMNSAIYSGAELLGSISESSSGVAKWSGYVSLSAPSGGWTGAKVRDLTSRSYFTQSAGTFSTGYVYIIQIEVTFETGARYLRATGNWNGSVWAATSNGNAGSAATPTASDNVYIADDLAVTLTANAACLSVFHTNGALSLDSYTLVVDGTGGGSGFNSTGAATRTLDLGSGTLDVRLGVAMGDGIVLSGSNLTLNAGTSLLTITLNQFSRTFDTLSKAFNDVRINLGSSSNATTLNITGSPTFRTLDIRSANSAAHTVNFESEDAESAAVVTLEKLIMIGSGASNRLQLTSSTLAVFFLPTLYASCYGQNLSLENAIPLRGFDSGDPIFYEQGYVGVNSTDNSGMWLLQDPPKISTLVDPLTTAPGSNSNWITSGISTDTTGYGGGGYALDSLGSVLVSSDTYDLLGSSVIIELSGDDESSYYTGNGVYSLSNILALIGGQIGNNYLEAVVEDKVNDNIFSGSTTSGKFGFIKINISAAGEVSVSFDQGDGFSAPESLYTFPPDMLPYLRSNRLSFVFTDASAPGGAYVVGSINTPPKSNNPGAFIPFFIP